MYLLMNANPKFKKEAFIKLYGGIDLHSNNSVIVQDAGLVYIVLVDELYPKRLHMLD